MDDNCIYNPSAVAALRKEVKIITKLTNHEEINYVYKER